MALTELFRQWFDEWSRESDTAAFFFVKNANNSAYLDVETDVKMARVTLWDLGNCDLEVIDVDSGSQIYWKTYMFNDWVSARPIVEKFVNEVINDIIPGLDNQRNGNER